jgi:hypothetical protein
MTVLFKKILFFTNFQIVQLNNHPRQTTEHLFLQCPLVLSLITQFEEHSGLSVNLTETEKRIGLDNNCDRSHIRNK